MDDDKFYLSLGNLIRKKVPNDPNITWDTKDENDHTTFNNLIKEFANNEDAIEIITLAKDLEGMLCNYGQHAAGVIIYDNEDITDFISTRVGKKGTVVETDMIQAEANGLLKMDFLGLKTLNIITDTVRMIKERTGKNIDPIVDLAVDANETSEFNSAPVYENIFKTGNTKNVFQFESGGMRSYLKKLEPSCIDDIVAMNALYRPGPMDYINDFIDGKKMKSEI